MAEALTQLALVVAALFTGAAVYVNAVEHPARRHLDPRAALQEWQPAYKRGAAMQATLALVGFVLAATAAFLGAGTLVALGAAFIIAPWPWTFLAIMPLNKRLLAMTLDEAELVPTCIRCLTVGTRCIVSARCSARRPQPACSGHRSGCSAMLGTGDDEDYEFNTKTRSSEDATKKSTMLARRPEGRLARCQHRSPSVNLEPSCRLRNLRLRCFVSPL